MDALENGNACMHGGVFIHEGWVAIRVGNFSLVSWASSINPKLVLDSIDLKKSG